MANVQPNSCNSGLSHLLVPPCFCLFFLPFYYPLFISNNKASELKFYHSDADPEYLLESVVRSCASDPIETKCSGIPVDGATSLIRTTCTESCAEDGCNTGWRKFASWFCVLAVLQMKPLGYFCRDAVTQV